MQTARANFDTENLNLRRASLALFSLVTPVSNVKKIRLTINYVYYKTTLCPVWFSEVITRGDKFQVTKCSLKRCVLRGKSLYLDFNSD